MANPQVKCFFEKETNTAQYVVWDERTRACAIIDSVWDYDAAAVQFSTKSADEIIAFVQEQGLRTEWILETHVHADHVTASQYLKSKLGGQVAIGEHITDVQRTFAAIYNLPDVATDGSQFDHLFRDNEMFQLGDVQCRVLHTPGHTPACVSYLMGDAVFVGDTIFMPDFGTARCDFPGGSAHKLYESIQRILALPPDTRVFVGHDYMPGGREVRYESTVAEERERNKHVHTGVSESEFVSTRETRDKQLTVPRLLLPALQINIRAGRLPPAEDSGRSYLKLPINLFAKA